MYLSSVKAPFIYRVTSSIWLRTLRLIVGGDGDGGELGSLPGINSKEHGNPQATARQTSLNYLCYVLLLPFAQTIIESTPRFDDYNCTLSRLYAMLHYEIVPNSRLKQSSSPKCSQVARASYNCIKSSLLSCASENTSRSNWHSDFDRRQDRYCLRAECWIVY